MSNTWKLVNNEGEPDFDSGGMDLEYQPDGTFTELFGRDVLDQRVRKAVVSRRGANPFDTSYGTTLRSRLGGKSTSKEIGATIGAELEDMIGQLKVSQGEARSRLGASLVPDELLVRANKFRVGVGNTEVQVQAELITESTGFTTTSTVRV